MTAVGARTGPAGVNAAPIYAGAALAHGARRIPGDAPRLEAEALLAHILGRPRGWLLAHPETRLSARECAEYEAALARLADGEPLAYLTGRREFFGLDFLVNPHVLVPRPETELLVETALSACGISSPASHALPNGDFELRIPNGGLRVADIGTGCGCIAVTLAARLPGAQVIAADISPQALEVARQNAARHAVLERIEFRQGDLLGALAGPVDLLCANLPYIDRAELADLEVARHEPRLALDGGPGGLEVVRRLLAEASRFVNPGGLVLVEIGASQGAAAAALGRAAFPGAAVTVHKDLASLDRLLVIQPSTPNP
jgi:release factor glutamine methyltransferase